MAASNERCALRTSTKIIRRGNGNSSCEYCLFTRGGAGTQARAGHTQLHWAGARAGQAYPAHGRRAVARTQEIRAAEAAVAGGVSGAGAASSRARMRPAGVAGEGGGIALQTPSSKLQGKPRSFDSGFRAEECARGAPPSLRMTASLSL